MASPANQTTLLRWAQGTAASPPATKNKREAAATEGKTEERARKRQKASPAAEPATSPAPQASAAPDGPRVALCVASWNTDGLDGHLCADRAGEVCSILLEETPAWDVVFLQEVVPKTARVFVGRLKASGYSCVTEVPSAEYFTLMFVREGAQAVKVVHAKRVPFGRSAMGRDLIEAWVDVAGHQIRLMTSHFESCREGAEERQRQLGVVVEKLQQPLPAIFAGDTNLREAEAQAEKRLARMTDAWVACGRDKSAQFTWDLQKNHNKEMPCQSQPRARYDRLWVNEKFEVQDFRLLGTDKMAEGCHPSDHFGISACIRLKD
uniref:Endonuclease/exonuclease/phosphatase domain-containing protein n=1 Tax=Eutreptiella gymnastica TaxID=73025 RepID=A0A7S4LFJ9_9EUGL